MNNLKIYFAPQVFYIRQNLDYHKEFTEKTNLKKLFEKDDGAQHYEFIDFHILKTEKTDKILPEVICKFGVTAGSYLTHTPFNHRFNNYGNNLFEPDGIIVESEFRFVFEFTKGLSNKLSTYSRYFTKDNEPWIIQIKYQLDHSTFRLNEIITYSDGRISDKYFHLISNSHLRTPEFYYSYKL
jgi:hypothetical protein